MVIIKHYLRIVHKISYHQFRCATIQCAKCVGVLSSREHR